ncbi:hypothetical protein XELAEV_18035882mg [Xenopus laevis]|uniref:Uncharacterized protein n=1 Tax=Xenopus laevis TaxID=8355 RepID=A0A974HCZ3_XENLA|nr:hypothetical protein XELAEV_18035882mg [Xenopus laevis]
MIPACPISAGSIANCPLAMYHYSKRWGSMYNSITPKICFNMTGQHLCVFPLIKRSLSNPTYDWTQCSIQM